LTVSRDGVTVVALAGLTSTGRTQMDATEKEAKARSSLRVAHRTCIGFPSAIDDFAAAVESRVRAELAAKVREMRLSLNPERGGARTEWTQGYRGGASDAFNAVEIVLGPLP
jgi:hypothetical protein